MSKVLPHTRRHPSTLPNTQGKVEASVGDYIDTVHHGCRLQHFWQVWESLFCHPRVVQILRWGYQIILQSNSPMSVHLLIQSDYKGQEKHGYLKDCISQMLQKCAIYPLKDRTTPGFYSKLFLVPKSGKKWRPVIDLSVLNSYMLVPTFIMETAGIIRNLVTEGLQYTTLVNSMYWFPLPFQLPVVI